MMETLFVELALDHGSEPREETVLLKLPTPPHPGKFQILQPLEGHSLRMSYSPGTENYKMPEGGRGGGLLKARFDRCVTL